MIVYYVMQYDNLQMRNYKSFKFVDFCFIGIKIVDKGKGKYFCSDECDVMCVNYKLMIEILIIEFLI